MFLSANSDEGWSRDYTYTCETSLWTLRDSFEGDDSEGGVKHVIGLETLCAYKRSKPVLNSFDSYLPTVSSSDSCRKLKFAINLSSFEPHWILVYHAWHVYIDRVEKNVSKQGFSLSGVRQGSWIWEVWRWGSYGLVICGSSLVFHPEVRKESQQASEVYLDQHWNRRGWIICKSKRNSRWKWLNSSEEVVFQQEPGNFKAVSSILSLWWSLLRPGWAQTTPDCHPLRIKSNSFGVEMSTRHLLASQHHTSKRFNQGLNKEL